MHYDHPLLNRLMGPKALTHTLEWNIRCSTQRLHSLWLSACQPASVAEPTDAFPPKLFFLWWQVLRD